MPSKKKRAAPENFSTSVSGFKGRVIRQLYLLTMDANTVTSNTTDPSLDTSVLPPVFDLAKLHLAEKRPIMLGISPGNPYYYKEENLRKLLQFANAHSGQVKLFITDVIGEHNYRAVGSSNPERASRVKGNRLRNKCKTLLKTNPSLNSSEITYVDWRKEVETCNEYAQELDYIITLFDNHEQFRKEVLEVTETALRCLCEGRKAVTKENKPVVIENVRSDYEKITPLNGEKNASQKDRVLTNGNIANEHLRGKPAVSECCQYDVIEGANYLLKELAFLLALPSIYKNFEKFVFVYHRPWPILENLFNGVYDGNVRTCLGFVILE